MDWSSVVQDLVSSVIGFLAGVGAAILYYRARGYRVVVDGSNKED